MEERSGYFALFVFLVSHDCCAALPHDAMGLPAVCDCGIFWSYSLLFLWGQKITHLRKSVFWSAFGYSNIAFIILLHFIIVPYLSLWMLIFLSIPSGCQQFAKVISRIQSRCCRTKSSLKTRKLVDTTFWINPWQKSISFASNFFHLAKVLATTNSEPQ